MVTSPAFFGVVLKEKTIKGCWYGSSNVQQDVPKLARPLQGGQAQARRAHLPHDQRSTRSTRRSRHGVGRGRPLGHQVLAGSILQPCGTDDSATASSWSPRSASAPGPSPATGGARSTTSRACCTPPSTPASTSSTPRPSTATDGVGETLLADVLKTSRDDDRPHHEVRLRHRRAARMYPGQSERPHDWRPESIRAQLEASLRRLGIDYDRPYQLHNIADRARSSTTTCGRARRARARGQGARARRRARPRDRLGRGGPRVAPGPPDRVAADRVQHPRAGAGPHVRGASRRSPTASIGLIARVPHASDTLSGKITRDTVFPPATTTARTATATTCSTTSTRPTRSRSSGRAPAGRSARRRSPASSPTRRSRRCSPRA